MDTPLVEDELEDAEELDTEGDAEDVANVVDDICAVPVDEAAVVMEEKVDRLPVPTVFTADTPIVGGMTTRLLKPQQASEVKPPAQHQLPSIAHCDIAISDASKPPFCPY
jgi:hypothetical protein